MAIVFPVSFLQHWPPGGSPMTTFQKALELIRKTYSAEWTFSELMLIKTALYSCMTTESITSPYTLRRPY